MGQIRGKVQVLFFAGRFCLSKALAHGDCGVGCLGRDRPQLVAGRFVDQNANQRGTQQSAEMISHGLHQMGQVRLRMQAVSYFGEDSSAALFFARLLRETYGLEKTPQLCGEDAGLGQVIGVEKMRIGGV